MEFVLNTVWFLVAAAAMVLLLPRWDRAGRGSNLTRDLLLLSCLAALLFPVISMTDDLHAQQMAFEEASTNQKRLLKATDQCRAPWGDHYAPALPSILSSQNPLTSAVDVPVDEPQHVVSAAASCRASGRAPPSVSHP